MNFRFANGRAGGESIRILTLARLTEIKGHEYALRAVANCATASAVRYDIVGERALRKNLEQLIGQLGYRKPSRCRGLRRRRIKAHMAESHIFVLASVNVRRRP